MAAQTEILSAVASRPRLDTRARTYRGAALAVLAGLLVLIPTLSDSTAHTAAYAAIFVIVGLSMNVLTGYTGQISLGQQAFVGLGSLTAANFVNTGTTAADPFTFAMGLLLGAAVAAAAALLLGAVALRIRGLYLALVTLVFGSVVPDAVFTLARFNGQDAGVSAYRPTFILSEYRFYLFALAIVAVVIYVDVWIRRSKVGRALIALRDNELVASAFGIDVLGYKLLGFAISGAFAGLAGGIWAFWEQEFSDKDYTSTAGFSLAITFLVMVVVGGLGSRAGVVMGAAFFALVSPLSPLLPWISSHTGWGNFYIDNKYYISNVIGAVLLLQTVILNPGGLGQVLKPFTRWFAGHPFSLHDPDGPAVMSWGGGSNVRA